MIFLPQNDRGTWLLVLLMLFGVSTLWRDKESRLGQIDFSAQISENSGFVNVPLMLNSKINLNKANLEDLRQIPKLNTRVAKAILEKRQLLGHFSNYQQLDEIKGVGVKTLETIKRHTLLDPTTR